MDLIVFPGRRYSLAQKSDILFLTKKSLPVNLHRRMRLGIDQMLNEDKSGVDRGVDPSPHFTGELIRKITGIRVVFGQGQHTNRVRLSDKGGLA